MVRTCQILYFVIMSNDVFRSFRLLTVQQSDCKNWLYNNLKKWEWVEYCSSSLPQHCCNGSCEETQTQDRLWDYRNSLRASLNYSSFSKEMDFQSSCSHLYILYVPPKKMNSRAIMDLSSHMVYCYSSHMYSHTDTHTQTWTCSNTHLFIQNTHTHRSRPGQSRQTGL